MVGKTMTGDDHDDYRWRYCGLVVRDPDGIAVKAMAISGTFLL